MGSLSGRSVLPMKAVPGELPDADGDWAYEIKWDGMRILAFLDEDGVRLASSNGNSATVAFPEFDGLTALVSGFDSMILDGEVVALGDDGLPSFAALQHRMHVTDPKAALARAQATPVTFAIFDLLHLNGHDTVGLPLADRRKLLEQIVDEPGPHWRLTHHTVDDPTTMLKNVTERGMEGLVAKRLDSSYQEGKRAKTWLKIKPTLRQEFVVGGWTEGRDGNTGGLGSLLLGVMIDGDDGERQLFPCGRAGSGLDDKTRTWWKEQLTKDALEESPFCAPVVHPGRVLHWSKPTHVVEVAFGEWTDDDRLRFPVYLGRRNDKDPADVVREVMSRRP